MLGKGQCNASFDYPEPINLRARLAQRERPGLVEQRNVHFGQTLECTAILDQ